MRPLVVLRHGAVGEIRFTRPEVLNAQGESWPDEMRAAIEELEADTSVRVVLVTGDGPAFCSGLDRDDLAAERCPPEWFRRADEAMRLLETMGKPTIAGVQGWCLGGGLQVAIVCDARVAADDAVFGLGATKLGFLPGMGGVWRLPRLVGMGWARHLTLSGERIDAAEALRIGLVHKVVPRADLTDELDAWAKRYLAVPTETVAWVKRLCNEAYDVPFEVGLEALTEGMRALLGTEEHLAARRAWSERRVGDAGGGEAT